MPTADEQHAFLDHAKGFNFDAVRELIEQCPAYVNSHAAGRWTALHQAAHKGDAEMVRYLLEHGADLELTTRDNKRARQLAVEGQARRGVGSSHDEVISVIAAAEAKLAVIAAEASTEAPAPAVAGPPADATPTELMALALRESQAELEQIKEALRSGPERWMSMMLEVSDFANVALGRFELGEVHLWHNSTADPRETAGDDARPTGFRFDPNTLLGPLATKREDFEHLFGDRMQITRTELDADRVHFILKAFVDHKFAWEAEAAQPVHFEADRVCVDTDEYVDRPARDLLVSKYEGEYYEGELELRVSGSVEFNFVASAELNSVDAGVSTLDDKVQIMCDAPVDLMLESVAGVATEPVNNKLSLSAAQAF